MNKIHQLYRIYDADKNLLYVGCSMHPINRLIAHKRAKPWFDQIKTIDFCNFKTKREALDAEIEAIRSEKPKYNLAWNDPQIKAELCLAKRQWIIDNITTDWYTFKRVEWTIYYPTLTAMVNEGLLERDYYSYRFL